MSEAAIRPTGDRPAVLSPRRGPAFAVVCVLVVAAILAAIGRDLSRRARVERFVAESGLALRRPLDAASVGLEPAPDLAAAAAILSVLSDAGPSSGAREAWLPRARDLAARGLAIRPGWPLHAYVLAEVAYREGGPGGYRRWMAAWRTAVRGAPAASLFRSRWAEACIAAWPSLPADERTAAAGAIRAAFADPEFVAHDMRAAADALGTDVAAGLLPARADSMRAGAAVLADRSADLERAKGLIDRADSLDESERAASLRGLEELARRGSPAIAEGIGAFLAAYPLERLDERIARTEAIRLLEIWPRVRASWDADGRAPLVRFLLDGTDAIGGRDGREGNDAARNSALQRAVDSLTGVPPPVLAELRDAAGDFAIAEKLRNSSSPEAASSDWTAYDIRSARRAITRGDLPAARRASDRVPPGPRDECDALLVRRDLARADGSSAGLEIERLLAVRAKEQSVSERWRTAGRIGLCIDSPASSGRSLDAFFQASAPAIVAYGWAGHRAGAEVISGTRRLAIRLPGKRGRLDFWWAVIAGGPVVAGEPSLE